MAEKLIYDILKGRNTLDPALKKSVKESSSLSKSLKGVGKTALGLKSAILGGAVALGLKAAVNEAVDLENALIGLTSVARNTGQDVGFITESAKELAKDGLIPLRDVSDSLKNLLAKGFNGEEAIRIFKSLRDAAAFNRQGQLELGEAVRGASEGLKNDLSIKVDNAGITKNLSNIQKEYAASINKTIGQLTEAEKRQALLVGIQKEAGVFQGDYNKLLNTFSGASSRAGTATRFLLAEIGNLVIGSPGATKGVNDVAASIEGLTQVIKENAPALTKLVNGLVTPLVRLGTNLANIASFAVAGLGVLADESSKAGSESRKTSNEVIQLTKSVKDLEAQLKIAEERGASDRIINGIKARIAAEKELLATKKNSLIELQDAEEKAREVSEETGGGKGRDINKDPDVLFTQEKNALLAQLDQERRDAELDREIAELDADQEKGVKRIEALQAQFDAENEVKEIQAQKDRAEAAKNAKDLEAISDESRRRELKKQLDFAKKSIDAERKKRLEQLGIMKKFADTAGGIVSAAAEFEEAVSTKKNKAIFLSQKILAAAQIIIFGQIAEAAAGAAPPIGVGPALAPALIALIRARTVLGLATVAATTIKGFQEGGRLSEGTRSGDTVLFRGNKEEAVFTRAQQAELFNLANGRGDSGGGNDDGIINALLSQPIILNIDGRQVATAVRDQVRGGFSLA